MDENDTKVLVGVPLMKEEIEELAKFLWKNKDMFSWYHKDIHGIDIVDIKYCLNIDPTFSLVRQKQRRFFMIRNKIVSAEINMLLEIDAIEC